MFVSGTMRTTATLAAETFHVAPLFRSDLGSRSETDRLERVLDGEGDSAGCEFGLAALAALWRVSEEGSWVWAKARLNKMNRERVWGLKMVRGAVSDWLICSS